MSHDFPCIEQPFRVTLKCNGYYIYCVNSRGKLATRKYRGTTRDEFQILQNSSSSKQQQQQTTNSDNDDDGDDVDADDAGDDDWDGSIRFINYKFGGSLSIVPSNGEADGDNNDDGDNKGKYNLQCLKIEQQQQQQTQETIKKEEKVKNNEEEQQKTMLTIIYIESPVLTTRDIPKIQNILMKASSPSGGVKRIGVNCSVCEVYVEHDVKIISPKQLQQSLEQGTSNKDEHFTGYKTISTITTTTTKEEEESGDEVAKQLQQQQQNSDWFWLKATNGKLLIKNLQTADSLGIDSEGNLVLVDSHNDIDPEDPQCLWDVESVTGELLFMSNVALLSLSSSCIIGEGGKKKKKNYYARHQLRCNVSGRLTLVENCKGWEVFRFLETGSHHYVRISSWMHHQWVLACNNKGQVQMQKIDDCHHNIIISNDDDNNNNNNNNLQQNDANANNKNNEQGWCTLWAVEKASSCTTAGQEGVVIRSKTHGRFLNVDTTSSSNSNHQLSTYHPCDDIIETSAKEEGEEEPQEEKDDDDDDDDDDEATVRLLKKLEEENEAIKEAITARNMLLKANKSVEEADDEDYTQKEDKIHDQTTIITTTTKEIHDDDCIQEQQGEDEETIISQDDLLRRHTTKPEDAALHITVSDPVQQSEGLKKYTLYRVDVRPPATATATASPSSSSSNNNDEVNVQDDVFLQNNTTYSVLRRYSDFLWLHERLHQQERAAGSSSLVIPPLPEKQPVGRFSAAFVEDRRVQLERFLRRLAVHPELADAKCLDIFLRADDMTFQTAKQSKEAAMTTKTTTKRSWFRSRPRGDPSLPSSPLTNVAGKNKTVELVFTEADLGIECDATSQNEQFIRVLKFQDSSQAVRVAKNNNLDSTLFQQAQIIAVNGKRYSDKEDMVEALTAANRPKKVLFDLVCLNKKDKTTTIAAAAAAATTSNSATSITPTKQIQKIPPKDTIVWNLKAAHLQQYNFYNSTPTTTSYTTTTTTTDTSDTSNTKNTTDKDDDSTTKNRHQISIGPFPQVSSNLRRTDRFQLIRTTATTTQEGDNRENNFVEIIVTRLYHLETQKYVACSSDGEIFLEKEQQQDGNGGDDKHPADAEDESHIIEGGRHPLNETEWIMERSSSLSGGGGGNVFHSRAYPQYYLSHSSDGCGVAPNRSMGAPSSFDKFEETSINGNELLVTDGSQRDEHGSLSSAGGDEASNEEGETGEAAAAENTLDSSSISGPFFQNPKQKQRWISGGGKAKLVASTTVGEAEKWVLHPVMPRAINSGKIKNLAIGTTLAVGGSIALPFAFVAAGPLLGAAGVHVGIMGHISMAGLCSLDALKSVGTVSAAYHVYNNSKDSSLATDDHQTDEEKEAERAWSKRPFSNWRNW